MNRSQFEALFPMIVTALLRKIIERKKITQDEAFSQLYNSRLYKALDNEEIKVWHYSADKLFELFEVEMTTGNLELPEY